MNNILVKLTRVEGLKMTPDAEASVDYQILGTESKNTKVEETRENSIPTIFIIS
jgi:hypothetical protein